MFRYIKKQETCLLPIICKDLQYLSGVNTIISNFSLEISSPGITVIMGPNGSGKSVFINLLHGLINPSSGSISFNDRPMDKSLRRKQAMVFQNPTILRRTVLENMLFVDSIDHNVQVARCKKILEMLDLDSYSNQPAKLLSAGEKQRLALARAIVLRPEIMFLDEPTANLDPASLSSIEKIVTNASLCGVKIIFITHDIGQAKRLSDDIIFIHRGRLTEHTKAANFFKSPQSKEARYYLEGKIFL